MRALPVILSLALCAAPPSGAQADEAETMVIAQRVVQCPAFRDEMRGALLMLSLGLEEEHSLATTTLYLTEEAHDELMRGIDALMTQAEPTMVESLTATFALEEIGALDEFCRTEAGAAVIRKRFELSRNFQSAMYPIVVEYFGRDR